MAPKPAKAKAATSAPKAKAKAKGKAEAEPTPEELLKKEGEEMWEKYKEETEDIVKLKGFAQCIRDMNTRKVNIWTDDDIGPNVIMKYSKSTGLHVRKELKQDEFVAWWPEFMEGVKARQDEVEAEETKREEEKAAKAAEKAARYEGDGLWSFPMKDLEDAMEEAFKKGKTPLILDDVDKGNRVEAFFTYSGGHIVEAKKMIMEKAKDKRPVEDILSEVRDKMFSGRCFQHGNKLIFRMANSAADIKGTFNNEVFPSLVLLDAVEVKKCIGDPDAFKGSPLFKMCVTDEERMDLIMGIHEKFRTVVISHFKEDNYEEFLKEMLPLDKMQPMKPLVD